MIQIVFSDSGFGIPDENIDKIWEPFFSTKLGGTGLGLTICKKIIEENHKGRIYFKRGKKDKATQFIMNLRIRQRPQI